LVSTKIKRDAPRLFVPIRVPGSKLGMVR
jgi:hypothetical protein